MTKIHLPERDNLKTGRYLMPGAQRGRWTLYAPDDTPIRDLNAYESRWVSAAHEPAAVTELWKRKAEQRAHEVLEYSRELEATREALRTASLDLESMGARNLELEQGMNKAAEAINRARKTLERRPNIWDTNLLDRITYGTVSGMCGIALYLWLSNAAG